MRYSHASNYFYNIKSEQMKKIFSMLAIVAILFTQQSFAQTNTNSQLSKVYSSYFALKDALVKTNGTLASESAGLMLLAIDSIDMATLSADEHSTWMTVAQHLKMNAQHIKENKDTEHQREHFMALSKNIYELMKVIKAPGTVYYQYCPMANDGKGANWLSKESAVKNPYYGAKMLSCGKTVETIKQ